MRNREHSIRTERFQKGIEVLETWNPKDNTVAINGERAYFVMNLFTETLEDPIGVGRVYDAFSEFGEDPELPAPLPDFCKSAGCALGTFGMNPWFRRRGLCAVPEEGTVYFKTLGHTYEDYYAASEFFKIDIDEADYIFGAGDYENICKVTPPDVAERMREVMSEYDR